MKLIKRSQVHLRTRKIYTSQTNHAKIFVFFIITSFTRPVDKL